MAENTAIEWTDHTFNPWVGCTRISPACDHCYAADWAKRAGKPGLWEPGAERQRTSAENWRKPLKWSRDSAAQVAAGGRRIRVFCASLADVFDNQVPPDWRADLWALIRATPDLDWQLLTKRPQNIAGMLPPDWGDGWPNVWLGTTVEDQQRADRNIPHLLAVPARVRFLSVEPLLGPVDLAWWVFNRRQAIRDLVNGPAKLNHEQADEAVPYPVDWVIVGGESGPQARPMHPAWVRAIRDQCAAADVPLLFKQWGEWLPDFETPAFPFDDDPEPSRFKTAVWDVDADAWAETNGSWDDCEQWDLATDYWQPEQPMRRVGKKRAGRTFEDITHDAFPEPRP